MPTPTYDLLDSQVLSTSAASVTFSSIPATYRDLVLVCYKLNNGAQVHTTLNNNTSALYSYVLMRGNGTTAVADSGAPQNRWHFTDGLDGTTAGILIINLFDYAVTDKHKTAIARYSDATKGTLAVAGRWASTSAVTSIEVYSNGGLFSAGATFYLYGIAS